LETSRSAATFLQPESGCARTRTDAPSAQPGWCRQTNPPPVVSPAAGLRRPRGSPDIGASSPRWEPCAPDVIRSTNQRKGRIRKAESGLPPHSPQGEGGKAESGNGKIGAEK